MGTNYVITGALLKCFNLYVYIGWDFLVKAIGFIGCLFFFTVFATRI